MRRQWPSKIKAKGIKQVGEARSVLSWQRWNVACSMQQILISLFYHDSQFGGETSETDVKSGK